MYKHYHQETTKNQISHDGLTNSQGHQQKYYAQWLFCLSQKGTTFHVAGQPRISDGWVGCFPFQEKHEKKQMFQTIVDAILKMVAEHFNCEIGVHDVLLLVKSSFHDEKNLENILMNVAS